MIDREGVAQRGKRGEWRGGDDGGLGGEGIPPRVGFPSGQEAEGGDLEGGVSLEAGDEGWEGKLSPYLPFLSHFTPSRGGS